MSAILYRARVELRSRWRATLLLALLFGSVAGVVIASVAGAQRTRTALDEFVEWSRPEDVTRFEYVQDEAEAELEQQARQILALPMVESGRRGGFVVFGEADAQGRILPGEVFGGLVVVGGDLDDMHRPLVVAGRLPDPAAPFEVAVNEALAARRSIEPGDQLRFAVYGREQTDLVGRGDVAPVHGIATMTVTGIVRHPTDLAFEPDNQEGTIYAADNEVVMLAGGPWRHFNGDLAGYGTGVMVHLRDGAELGQFAAAADEMLGSEGIVSYEPSETTSLLGPVDRAIDRQADALIVFGSVVGLVGFAIAGQALARQVALGASDVLALRTAGMTRAQRAGAAALWGAVVAVLSALLAVGLAVSLSGLAPIGIARRAELDPGVAVDLRVIALGTLFLLLAVPAWAAVKGWRAGRVGANATAVDRASRTATLFARAARRLPRWPGSAWLSCRAAVARRYPCAAR